MITPNRIRAFLDDLALVSVKHSMTITAADWVQFHDGAPDGYSYRPSTCDLDPSHDYYGDEPDGISSLDVSTATAHQRIALERSLAEVRERADG